MEHLLGLMIAFVQHKLYQMFYRGDPELLKGIFNDIAKEWKKFFEPGKNVHVYNMSDEVREFAKDYCGVWQKWLRSTTDRPGEKYNFNYIRIPRPAQSKALAKRKAVDKSNDNNLKEGEEESTKKKKSKM